jgi:hypothetical protein
MTWSAALYFGVWKSCCIYAFPTKDQNLRGTKYEDCGSNLNCSLSGETVGNEGRSQSANEGTCRHGSSDAALQRRYWVMEVVLVRIRTQHTTHRRDVKAEETTTYFKVSLMNAHH